MAYNVFIKVDQIKINKLPFIMNNYQYYYKDGNDAVNLGILYEVDKDSYVKIEERLKGLSSNSISPGDKVFVMSGCKIPLFKIKDHCKKIGAGLTSDINQATFFIGNCNTSDQVTYGGRQANPTAIIFHQNNIQHTASIRRAEEEYDSANISDTFTSIDANNYPEIMISGFLTYESKWMTQEGRKWFITPLAAMILYNSLAKSLPIVNEDTIYAQICPVCALDAESYETINNMLGSSDQQNVNIGCELLANCDIDPSIMFIYKLSQEHRYEVNGSRIKNVKLFVHESNWNELGNLNAEEFINYLYDRNLLTKEYFNELIFDASKLYNTDLQSNLFTMQMKPTNKFKEFSDESHIFNHNFADPEQEEQEEEEEEEYVEEGEEEE